VVAVIGTMIGAVVGSAHSSEAVVTDQTVSCLRTTSTSLELGWIGVPDTDLYYVALSVTPEAKPFAIRTTANTSLSLIDLAPDTTYYLSLRSHPETEPTIAWAPGWRAPSAPVKCKTSARPAISDVRRVGELADSSFGLAFDVEAGSTLAAGRFEVGIARAASFELAEATGAWDLADSEYTWAEVEVVARPGNAVAPERISFEATVTGLAAGATYFAKVRPAGGFGEGDSHPEVLRTKTPGMVYTVAHRISEYAEDVDFLENHDAASVEAMPLYLMTCSPEGNCQPWNKTQFTKTDSDWDDCESMLAHICPSQRGIGFNGCVQCIDEHHDEVVAACGNYTDEDKEHPGYPVHYYCGIGWPENLMYFSAITEYCVEHLPAPHADPRWGPGGFAQYTSCNSDEVDAAFNNSARDPTCMCWVWDDRQMSMLPESELNASCGGHMPWFVHEPICNCTRSKEFPESTVITEDSPSYRYVGAMPTFLPWGYYRTPRETFPVRIPMGFNYVFPKAGSCKPGQKPGDDGCQWLRNPSSRMIFGPDLYGSGWDPTFVPDTLTNQSHTRYNIGVFAKATHLHDHLLTRRCCGC